MRANEICEMQLSDIHETHFHVAAGKTGAAVRDVPIHPMLKPLVKKLAKRSEDGYLLSSLRRGGEDSKRNHGILMAFGKRIRKIGVSDSPSTFTLYATPPRPRWKTAAVQRTLRSKSSAPQKAV